MKNETNMTPDTTGADAAKLYEPRSDLAKMLQAIVWEVATIAPMAFAKIHVDSALKACDELTSWVGEDDDKIEILVQIQREKNARQWGGASHDDTHNEADWIHFIDKQLRKAIEAESYMRNHDRFGGIGDYMNRLITIAALAMDAYESVRRVDAARSALAKAKGGDGE